LNLFRASCHARAVSASSRVAFVNLNPGPIGEFLRMICVSIGRSRHKMMMAVHRHMAERGASLCELRLDILQHNPDLGRLLADRPTPVIVTCRRQQDKGLWKYTEEQRLTVLRSAIVAGVEYVTSRKTRPSKSAATARRSGSSATTTSRRRRTTWRRSTPA
jgi:hypothetical protein